MSEYSASMQQKQNDEKVKMMGKVELPSIPKDKIDPPSRQSMELAMASASSPGTGLAKKDPEVQERAAIPVARALDQAKGSPGQEAKKLATWHWALQQDQNRTPMERLQAQRVLYEAAQYTPGGREAFTRETTQMGRQAAVEDLKRVQDPDLANSLNGDRSALARINERNPFLSKAVVQAREGDGKSTPTAALAFNIAAKSMHENKPKERVGESR